MLTVPDCPHASLFEARLAAALIGLPTVEITRAVVTDVDQAQRWDMRGSPTLLINGADPFSGPRQPASLSCRLYRDGDGNTSGAPSVEALRAAIERAQT